MPEGPLELKISTEDAHRKLSQFPLNVRRRVIKQTFMELHGYWSSKLGRGFQSAGRATGGTFRGERWKGFAPQYKRKSDGVLVPAWGGVRKAHGKGMVQGRKRPSGARVTRSSKLMQDTGTMVRTITERPLSVTEMMMRIGYKGAAAKYGPYQNAMRPHMFWRVPMDERMGGRILGRRIVEEIARSGLQ